MSADALPCIVCGKTLANVFPNTVQNQPEDGVACSTVGNYGSTVWDSMNGGHLEFNVCDDCLMKAGERGQIYMGRNQRPVLVDDMRVGWEELDRPLVHWRADLPGYLPDDELHLSAGDLDGPLPRTVRLNYPLAETLRMLRAWRDAR